MISKTQSYVLFEQEVYNCNFLKVDHVDDQLVESNALRGVDNT